jgi:nucleoside-diphosphate-sugar epimerase
MAENPIVLVSGVNGVSGRAAAEHWATVPGAKVYGLARRDLPMPAGVELVPVDLLRPEEVQRKLGAITGVTHLVLGAYVEKRDTAERTAFNVALVKNLLDVAEASSGATLRHVTLYQGSKAYGADLGPFKTPARETDPRLMPPNFYYDQEDLLRERQRGKAWRWTVLRPEGTSGYGLGNPMNVAMSIAIYAVISKELGLPLRFPGTEKSYRILYNITYAKILARATAWAGTCDAARNEIFNITNGDYFRWSEVWPQIAAMFDMPVADPLPTPLAVYLADKAPLWDAIVRKYNLRPVPYEQVSAWAFADVVLGLEYDTILSTIKARQAGFHDSLGTREMFEDFLGDLRREKIIPNLPLRRAK